MPSLPLTYGAAHAIGCTVGALVVLADMDVNCSTMTAQRELVIFQ
jgi:hypothetical protein